MSDAERYTGDPARYDFSNDPDGLTRELAVPHDWLLESLLEFVLGYEDQNNGNTISVTLTISGIVVSGQLITRTEWRERLAASLPAEGAKVAEFIDAVTETVWESQDERRSKRRAADLPVSARRFIHLKDVTLQLGNGSASVAFWRGQLSSIDGWAIGRP